MDRIIECGRFKGLGFRLLLFSDTHLGLDLPTRGGKPELHRGEDLFDNFHAVLEAACTMRVDAVVHAGDLFFRSKLPDDLIDRVYTDLNRFMKRSIPLLIVPGNHERSALPPSLLIQHPKLFVFHGPATVRLKFQTHPTGELVAKDPGVCEFVDVAISGFPHMGAGVERELPGLLSGFRSKSNDAAIRLLVLHEAVAGARVCPWDFTFRKGPGVIPPSAFPAWLHGVLVGHIHRAQVLLGGSPRRSPGCGMVPLFHCGSIEKTSFSEVGESKGFFLMDFEPSGGGWSLGRASFHELPTRHLASIEIESPSLWDTAGREWFMERLNEKLRGLPERAVARVNLPADLPPGIVKAEEVRKIVGPEVIVEIRRPSARTPRRT